MNSVKLLYVTCETLQQARTIGRTIVEEKLAACINILPQMESIYLWQGKIETSNEVVLIIKTSDSLTSKCSARIKELHSYTVPCILQTWHRGREHGILNMDQRSDLTRLNFVVACQEEGINYGSLT